MLICVTFTMDCELTSIKKCTTARQELKGCIRAWMKHLADFINDLCFKKCNQTNDCFYSDLHLVTINGKDEINRKQLDKDIIYYLVMPFKLLMSISGYFQPLSDDDRAVRWKFINQAATYESNFSRGSHMSMTLSFLTSQQNIDVVKMETRKLFTARKRFYITLISIAFILIR